MSLREKLAELAHQQWSGWMEYLFTKSTDFEGCSLIPADLVSRWMRQMRTDYSELPENEKDSDRAEADKYIAVFQGDIAQVRYAALKEAERAIWDAELPDMPNDVSIVARMMLVKMSCLDAVDKLKTGVGLHASQQPHATDAATAPRG